MSTRHVLFSNPGSLATLALAFTLVLVVVIGCGDEEDSTGPDVSPIVGGLVAQSDCGGYTSEAELSALPSNQSGVLLFYDGKGELSLQHNNAAFNCCPEIKARVSVEGNTIVIEEKDTGLCDCLCLYDIDYKVTGVSPGTYNIRFEELYLQEGDQKLEFAVTLGELPMSDTVVVLRDHYPWHPPDKPLGALFAFSSCGGFDSTRYAFELPADSNCIEYKYDVSNTLTISHQNATFNCCIESLQAVITVDGNIINIVESENAPEPCFCVCPYDLDMRIVNLLPGEYTLNISSPYLTDPIQLALDLVNEPCGYLCVDSTVPN